jgi:ribonuclease HII
VTRPTRFDPASRLDHERKLRAGGFERIAGVDEAGRGPLAGPVVAAAVILPATWIDFGLPDELQGLNDSKQLSASQRARYHDHLIATTGLTFAVARLEADAIDALNILRATHEAMRRALRALGCAVDHVLVDGLPVLDLGWPHTALVQGDARSYSIAAASVLAKAVRDRLMLEHDRRYPLYGFAVHKGYPTAAHLAALARHGPCPIHRRTFAPLRAHQMELLG